MNFGWVYPEDSGEYVCRATNKYGMDETRAFIKTTGSKGIIYDSQLPKGMQSVEMIREMEASWQRMPDERAEAEVLKEKPVFVLQPKNVQVMEGEWARFCCRVTGYPRPRVMWILNGHTVINGTRNKLTYDGMWHLDIPKTRQYDDGKLEVVARNSQGSASCVVELKVTARNDDHRGVLKNSPKQDNLRQLHGIQESIQRMRQVSVQTLRLQSQVGRRLRYGGVGAGCNWSLSCPSLSGSGGSGGGQGGVASGLAGHGNGNNNEANWLGATLADWDSPTPPGMAAHYWVGGDGGPSHKAGLANGSKRRRS